MPADDALFEKALARQMRNRAPSDNPAANGESASGEAGAEQRNLGPDACPNAEILAAYHERLLVSEEMNLWKGHVFSCTRCQEILSQLEATEDVLVGTHEENFAAAGPAPAPVVMRRRAIRYWIAPAGAIAAGLFVWLGMHYQSQNISRRKEVEIAENRPAAPPNGTAEPYSVANTDNKAAAPPRIDKLDSGTERELRALVKKNSSEKTPAPEVTNAPGALAGTSAGTAANEATAKLAGKPARNADAGGEQVVPKAVTQTVEVTSAAAPVAQDQMQMSSGANTAPLPARPQQELPAM